MNMRANRTSRNRQLGLTMIELMVALALGLVITAAVGYVYLSGLQGYRTQDALSRMQENARYAFEIISTDVRLAGSLGCDHATAANDLVDNTDWFKDVLGKPLNGEDDVTSGSACAAWATPCKVGTDMVTSLYADNTQEHIVQAHDLTTSLMTLDTIDGITSGELLVVTDCSHTAIFQATAVDATGKTVEHLDAASAGSPAGSGNLSEKLGTVSMPGPVYNPYTYVLGSKVYPLHAATYYIATNPAGQPALYRQVPQGNPPTPTAEEVVEGVEGMQILFGVDMDDTNDNSDNFTLATTPYLKTEAYKTSAEIIALAPTASIPDWWARVTSIKISLLLRTTEDGVLDKSQTYTFPAWAGSSTTAGDRRLRKVFTHVIDLRNR